MVNVKNAIALGLLASTASAATLHNGKRHVHHRRHNKPCTTDIPYPIGNSTQPAGTGVPDTTSTLTSTSTSEAVVTYTVVPVPINPSSTTDAPVAPTTGGTSENTSPAAGVPSGPAGGDCSVATAYVTVQQTVTVTAGQVPETTSTSSVTAAPVAPSEPAVSKPVEPAPEVPASSSSTPVAAAPAFLQTGAPSAEEPAAPATTSEAPVKSVSPVKAPAGGSYSGAKMGASWIPGVGFDTLGLSNVPWVYDWEQVPRGIPQGTEYIPTLHDGEKCANFANQLASQSGVTYVKHFNEPDMTGNGGSGMSPGQAASLHKQYISAISGQYKVGLPSVTSHNVDGVSGTGWLRSFVQQVGGCSDFSFADFHFYGGSEVIEKQAEIFLGYVDDWVKVVDEVCPGQNLPIWITEFSAGPADGNAANAARFMAVAAPQLEKNARVARYAYFFPRNDQITSAFNGIVSALKSVGL